jgi:hypothetical protein
MCVGETFETVDDAGQPVVCEVVFTGGMSLFSKHWPTASSLQANGRQQPAKSQRSGGRSTPCASSQASLRA